MKKEELLFHKLLPGLICLALFEVAGIIGRVRLVWHFFFMLAADALEHPSYPRHAAFVYRYMKSRDHTVCVELLNGLSDETISNAAGRRWQAQGFQSAWWVLWVKKITDGWTPEGPNGECHIVQSIEPLRPDYWSK